ncbi:MAG: DUF6263 family protein [Bacteroidales bacterium]|nr:DUF6263 family protein [Bacteroidales bacterium]
MAYISFKGKVLKLKKTENLLKDIKKKIKKLPPQGREQIWTNIQSYASPETLSSSIEALTFFFHDSTVSLEEKWKVNKTEYYVDSQTDTTYIIIGEGIIDEIISDEIEGMTMKTQYLKILLPFK